MLAGEFVDTGSVRDLIRDARHPYTRGLLAANLHGARKGERLEAISGTPPGLQVPPTPRSFAPRDRCPKASLHRGEPPAADLGIDPTVRRRPPPPSTPP